jgi:APA family basic amino acid/polyamine antiporter
MRLVEEGNGLRRTLGLFPVTNIVIANMIGAGIFTTSGLLMENLGDVLLMIFLWIVGGLIALCGALSYGELGAAIPRAGGEYAYLSRMYHPVSGFLSGWVSLFAGFSAPIAASAIGFAEYLTRAFPDLILPGVFGAIFLKKTIAVFAIAMFTLIHVRGSDIGARVQNYLTLLKVVLIVGLIFFGFTFGKGSLEHVSQGIDFHFDFRGWRVIGLSLMWIMFAYSGWNASAYIGSEIKNPSRNLPGSLLLGTGVVMILYVFLNLLYAFAISPQGMKGVISIGGLAVGELFGRSLENVVSILISFALFSSLSAFMILGPRVYYSMARDRLFFRFASEVHPKYGVPSKSILLQGGVAALMVSLGTFDQILTYMGFSLGIFPILAVAGVFKLRRSQMSRYKLPGFPIVPILYLAAGTSILFLAFFERPLESSIAILTVIVGIPVYVLFQKRE